MKIDPAKVLEPLGSLDTARESGVAALKLIALAGQLGWLAEGFIFEKQASEVTQALRTANGVSQKEIQAVQQLSSNLLNDIRARGEEAFREYLNFPGTEVFHMDATAIAEIMGQYLKGRPS